MLKYEGTPYVNIKKTLCTLTEKTRAVVENPYALSLIYLIGVLLKTALYTNTEINDYLNHTTKPTDAPAIFPNLEIPLIVQLCVGAFAYCCSELAPRIKPIITADCRAPLPLKCLLETLLFMLNLVACDVKASAQQTAIFAFTPALERTKTPIWWSLFIVNFIFFQLSNIIKISSTASKQLGQLGCKKQNFREGVMTTIIQILFFVFCLLTAPGLACLYSKEVKGTTLFRTILQWSFFGILFLATGVENTTKMTTGFNIQGKLSAALEGSYAQKVRVAGAIIKALVVIANATDGVNKFTFQYSWLRDVIKGLLWAIALPAGYITEMGFFSQSERERQPSNPPDEESLTTAILS